MVDQRFLRRRGFARRVVWLAAWAMLAAGAVRADNGTWGTDGSGDWGNPGAWSGGVIADGTGYTADFSQQDITQADRYVYLYANRTIGNLKFGDTDPSSAVNWMLTDVGGGNVLTLDGPAPTITVNAMGPGLSGLEDGTAITASIYAVIAGSHGLVKDGPGILSLYPAAYDGGWRANRSNTYTGGTTVLAGTLNPRTWPLSINYFNFGGSLTMADGTALVPDSGGGTIRIADPLTLSGGSVTVMANNNGSLNASSDLIFEGVISGPGRMLAVGANNANNRRFEIVRSNPDWSGGLTLDLLPTYPSGKFPGLRLTIYQPDSLGTGTVIVKIPRVAATGTYVDTGIEIGSSLGYAVGDMYNGLDGTGVKNDIEVRAGANLNAISYVKDGVVRDLQLSGVISGPGSVTKYGFFKQGNNAAYGEGTLWLSAANTYTGSTSIFRGTLKVSTINSVNGGTPAMPSSNLGAPLTDADGVLTFGRQYTSAYQTVSYGGGLLYAGTGETTDRQIRWSGGSGGLTLDQSGTGLLKFSHPVVEMLPGLIGYSNSKTLTLQGSTAGSGELAGAVSNSVGGIDNATSLTKNGTGTWTLSGDSSYTGPTRVLAGRLLVSNATGSGTGTSAVTVEGAGTLGGTGTIGGLVTSRGTIAPGAPGAPGTLSIAGGLNFDSTGYLAYRIGSAASDLIDLKASPLYASGVTTINLTDAGIAGAGTWPLIKNIFDGYWEASNFALGPLPPAWASYTVSLVKALAGAQLDLVLTRPAVVSQWNGPGGGDWAVAENWDAGVPNGNVDTARLWSRITADAAVDLKNADATVKALSFQQGSPSGNYTIQATGSGKLHLAADSGPATIEVQSGAQRITAAVVLDSPTQAAVTSAAASLTLSGPVSGTGSLTLVASHAGKLVLAGNNFTAGFNGGATANAGTLQLDSADALPGGSSLTLTGTARVALGGATSTNLGSAVKLGDLAINADSTAPTAVVNLNKSKLIVDKTQVSPATIRSQIKNAYAAAAWTGGGITSAAAAGDYALLGGSAKTGVGYLDNAILASQGGSKTAWQGRSVNSTSLLIRYTYYGDANLDGVVSLPDFGILKSNFGISDGSAHWYQADFNYDGKVNLTDFGKLKNSFGSPAIAAGAAVPEPAAAALLAAAAASLLLRAARRKRRAG